MVGYAGEAVEDVPVGADEAGGWVDPVDSDDPVDGSGALDDSGDEAVAWPDVDGAPPVDDGREPSVMGGVADDPVFTWLTAATSGTALPVTVEPQPATIAVATTPIAAIHLIDLMK